ncbi:MAG: hypothetical protein WBJ82_00470 [Tepidanaerobacteraceae bacterium]|nr:hypothetical protein [Tepidanaerobacter sp.]HQA60293.1 hypothetical protein [Tepidanaerobacteraceae bacterium]HQE05098.1 hypothetical protein [Tepidanaerobacteraceae bacterium]
MWTVIYMATDKDTAHKVVQAIKDEGFLVKTREVMKSKKHGCCIEISVPESEAQEAQNVILEKNL